MLKIRPRRRYDSQRKNDLIFGPQPETDLICKSSDRCLKRGAETLVDASLWNRVSDWKMRILEVEILMQIGDEMYTDLQKTIPAGRKRLINTLRGMLSAEESSCDIDEDITKWVQTTINVFPFRKTFRTVSLWWHKATLRNDTITFPIS